MRYMGSEIGVSRDVLFSFTNAVLRYIMVYFYVLIVRR